MSSLTGWKVTNVRVPIAGLSGQGRIRIVQISDVHSGPHPRLEESLPEIIGAQSPDYIVFTGDALNSRPGLPVFRRLMSRLSNIAPTYAVLGNWDTDVGRGPKLFAGTGAKELDGEFVDLGPHAQHLRLAGARFAETLRLEQTVRAARDATPVVAAVKSAGAVPPPPLVVLAHSPDAIEYAKGADLLLAGHTHGGQIRLPWYGALITLTETGKKYESGLHRAGPTWVYTNRGIGVEAFLPLRFLCRPEVTVIDLVPQH